jgi:hypothetical protein
MANASRNMERVALSQLVNEEIRALAERLDLREEGDDYVWLCACGCLAMTHASLAEYDDCAGQIFAAGHPFGAERAEATAAFERESDTAAVARRVDESERRELTAELARTNNWNAKSWATTRERPRTPSARP